MSQYNWLGGFGDGSNPLMWYPGGTPDPHANVIVTGYGVVSWTGKDLSQNTVWLNRSGDLPVNIDVNQGALGNLNGVGDGGPITVEVNNTPLFGGFSSTGGVVNLAIDHNSAAVNYGTMLAQGGATAAELDVHDEAGAFGNNGNIVSSHQGNVNFDFALPQQLAPGQPHEFIGNTGTISATDGGRVAFNAGHSGGGSFGFLFNQGAVIADGAGSTVIIDSDMLQLPAATTFIQNGGTVQFNDGTSLGTVQVDNGTMQFGLYAPGVPGPVGAIAFNATINLTGPANFDFENTAIKIAFDEARQDLSIFTDTATPVKLNDFHVQSTAFGHLVASEFTSNGTFASFRPPEPAIGIAHV